ncbi:hypothetical protein EVAR_103851_1 [Eumeta japonica]|uniref:Uncharacterized protein n=1 Tax=Eumeta variegata TaxID=151549 RepID=A0A4C2AB46_EUMVA|nr:hypothetical protein EVAR_103851_1 [Eumeta japonica]
MYRSLGPTCTTMQCWVDKWVSAVIVRFALVIMIPALGALPVWIIFSTAAYCSCTNTKSNSSRLVVFGSSRVASAEPPRLICPTRNPPRLSISNDGYIPFLGKLPRRALPRCSLMCFRVAPRTCGTLHSASRWPYSLQFVSNFAARAHRIFDRQCAAGMAVLLAWRM